MRQNAPSEHITPDFIALMNSMLHVDPSQRLVIADILFHPWMQSGTPIATAEDVANDMLIRRNTALANAEQRQLE